MRRALVLMGVLGLGACAAHQPPSCSGPSVVLDQPAIGTGENALRPPPPAVSPIAPAEVTDNGQVTAFLFPNNQTIPRFYYLAPDGDETLAQFQMYGDFAVVPFVAPAWHLRLGKSVVCLLNPHYSPIGINPHTGTDSPDVLLDRGRT